MSQHEVEIRAELMLDARYPILYFVSWEEERLLRRLHEMAEHLASELVVWSVSRGMLYRNSAPLEWQEFLKKYEGNGPVAALDFALNWPGPQKDLIFVLKDLHPWLRDPQIGTHLIRRLRDAASEFRAGSRRQQRRNLILLSPVLYIPPELEKDITILDYPLPDREEIGEVWNRAVLGLKNYEKTSDEIRDLLVRAAQGLTEAETADVYRRLFAFKAGEPLEPGDTDFVAVEKEQIILKSRTLEFFTAHEDFSNVGGMESLKAWLRTRARAFTPEAKAFGLSEPRGVLLLGVPGCGKSMCAKVIATEWHMPLLRLDIGRIFGGLVGSSEENVRNALKVAESVSPCVLWLDEIEKGFVGMQGGGDSGVTARVFGTLLTWMQEKKKPAFVVATANDIRSLPPELLRKGRFDEIFFVDLPSEQERQAIFRVHVTKRATEKNELGKLGPSIDYRKLAQLSDGLSGAEIEQAVESALFAAFLQIPTSDQTPRDETPAPPNFDYTSLVSAALAESVPLSKAMPDTVKALRDWAKTRARFASPQPGGGQMPSIPDPGLLDSRLTQKLESPFVFRRNRMGTMDDVARLFERDPQEGIMALRAKAVERWFENNGLAEDAAFVKGLSSSDNMDYAVREFISRFKAPTVH